MDVSARLRPTLWRTCRVLANPTRLKMFSLLLQQPGQTVSAVAEHLSQPLSLTSEYLRALEARGFLRAPGGSPRGIQTRFSIERKFHGAFG